MRFGAVVFLRNTAVAVHAKGLVDLTEPFVFEIVWVLSRGGWVVWEWGKKRSALLGK